MIDFHSHILPGIDDGASNIEESLKMLSSLKEQGVTTVVATPHFLGDRSIKGFLEKRDNAYSTLKSEIESRGIECPEIILGAEVALNERLLKHENLERLCIGDTRIIMIEMPYCFWDPYLYQMLFVISAQVGLRIMIAHAERYFSLFGKNEKLFKLMDMQPVFQINTTSLDFRKGRKFIKLLDKLDSQFVLGSDCHNLNLRKPLYSQPLEFLVKKFGKEYLDEINSFSSALLSGNSF